MEACIGYQVTSQCKCLSSWLYKTDTSQEMCASDNGRLTLVTLFVIFLTFYGSLLSFYSSYVYIVES